MAGRPGHTPPPAGAAPFAGPAAAGPDTEVGSRGADRPAVAAPFSVLAAGAEPPAGTAAPAPLRDGKLSGGACRPAVSSALAVGQALARAAVPTRPGAPPSAAAAAAAAVGSSGSEYDSADWASAPFAAIPPAALPAAPTPAPTPAAVAALVARAAAWAGFCRAQRAAR